jgi:alpha-N-acetylglucosamine transferase
MSKNLIYTCCFHQEIYTDVVSHMINSFLRMNSSIDLLVYTTTEYKEIIQKKCPLATNILFVEKNFYKTMNQARISKLDVFDFPQIEKYEKVLYLDADSLFLKKPDDIFGQITDDIVYTIGEGSILNEGEYWGRSLFLKENAEYVDREGLGAYALGFKNITVIKKLFIKIKQAFYLDMYQNKLRFYDQPFLNFFLIQNNMCNTEALKTFVKSRPSAAEALDKGIAIVHFAGCPGHGNVKLDLIDEFKTDYEKIKPQESETVALLKMQLAEMREKTAQLEALLLNQLQ